MQKNVAKKAASAPLKSRTEVRKTRVPPGTKPASFLYTAAAYMFERRESGWYVAKWVSSVAGQRPQWTGPFESIETASLSAARHLAAEVADRHTRSIEQYKLDRKHPLHGLKKAK